MSVVRTGSNQQFAEGWEKVFGGGKKKSGGKKTAKKATSKKTAKKKSAKKN